MRYFLFIFFIVLLSSCLKKEDTTAVSSKKKYFDLISVVQQDISENIKVAAGEEKIILISGKEEIKKTDTVDWNKELATLLECDINKPSWEGKYTIQETATPKKISYNAISPKLPIRSMTIYYADTTDSISYIEIEKKIGTFLFSNRQHIFYYPGKSFKIVAQQQAVFMQDFNSTIEVKYINHSSVKSSNG